MLAISKHHKLMKALPASALAFGMGIMSAAAYVGGTLVHENLAFALSKDEPNSAVQNSDDSQSTNEDKKETAQERSWQSGSSSQRVSSPGSVGTLAPSLTPAVSSATGTASAPVAPVDSPAPTPTMSEPVVSGDVTDPVVVEEPPKHPKPVQPTLVETVEAMLPPVPEVQLLP